MYLDRSILTSLSALSLFQFTSHFTSFSPGRGGLCDLLLHLSSSLVIFSISTWVPVDVVLYRSCQYRGHPSLAKARLSILLHFHFHFDLNLLLVPTYYDRHHCLLALSVCLLSRFSPLTSFSAQFAFLAYSFHQFPQLSSSFIVISLSIHHNPTCLLWSASQLRCFLS